jgi:hypothetical protein
MIQNFIIVAQDNKGDERLPTRSLQTKTEDGSRTLYIGSGWVRKNENGETFLSCAMKKNWTSPDGKKYDGYVVITEDEYTFLKNCEARVNMLTSDGSIDMAKHPLNSASEQKAYDDQLSQIGF